MDVDTQDNLIFSICLLEARGLASRLDTHSFWAELSRKHEEPWEVRPATILRTTTWHRPLQKDLGSWGILITYYLQALPVPRHFECQRLLSSAHIPEVSQQMPQENNLSVAVRSVKRFFKVKSRIPANTFKFSGTGSSLTELKIFKRGLGGSQLPQLTHTVQPPLPPPSLTSTQFCHL